MIKRLIFLILLVISIEAHAQTVVTTDTFTEASDTNLVNHTAGTGESWAEADTGCSTARHNILASSDQLRNISGQASCSLLSTVEETRTNPKYDIQFDVADFASASGEANWCVVGYYTDANNSVGCCVSCPTCTGPDIGLFKKTTSGGVSQVATSSTDFTAGNTLILKLRGNTWECYEEGNLRASHTCVSDCPPTSNTKAGVASGSYYVTNGDASGQIKVDNLTVTEIPAAGGTTQILN